MNVPNNYFLHLIRNCVKYFSTFNRFSKEGYHKKTSAASEHYKYVI